MIEPAVLTPQHEMMLERTCIQIQSSHEGIPTYEGSGVLYAVPDVPDAAYVITALHCILGPRSDGAYPNTLDTISNIQFGVITPGTTQVSQWIQLQTDEIICDKRTDLAIFPIRTIVLPESSKPLPRISICHRAETLATHFSAMGFPSFGKGERQIIPFQFNDGFRLPTFQVVSKLDFSGEGSKLDLEGFSGSGVFSANRPELVGVVTKVPLSSADGAVASLVKIQRLETRHINSLISSKSKNLPKLPSENGDRFEINAETGLIELDYQRFEFEGIELNIWKAVERARSDSRDDWYQDPIEYRDFLQTKVVVHELRKRSAPYSPSMANPVLIPKKGFTTRTSVVTSPLDRVLVQALVDKIAAKVDRTIVPNVYSFRHDSSLKRGGKQLFIDRIEQWKKFQQVVQADLDRKGPYLVCTDISSYFNRIAFSVLKCQLSKLVYAAAQHSGEAEEDLAQFQRAIDLLVRIMKSWAPSEHLPCGIPQNRETSSFLANAILFESDKYMASRYVYYRFMDDIRIICDSENEAKRAIVVLSKQLGNLGVHLNAAKTKILHKREARSVAFYLPDAEYQLQQVDNLIKSARARPIQSAVALTQTIFNEALDEPISDVRERKIRFCIERFSRFAAQPFLSRKIDWKPILKKTIPMLDSFPWMTDSIIRMFRSVGIDAFSEEDIFVLEELIAEPAKTTYTWQGYHVWILLGAFKVNRPRLVKAAQNLISSPPGDRMPLVAAACLYLAANDSTAYRTEILDAFNRGMLSGILCERSALIALQGLEEVDVPLLKHRPDLQVSYQILREYCREHPGLTISDIPKLEMRHLLRDLPAEVSPVGFQ